MKRWLMYFTLIPDFCPRHWILRQLECSIVFLSLKYNYDIRFTRNENSRNVVARHSWHRAESFLFDSLQQFRTWGVQRGTRDTEPILKGSTPFISQHMTREQLSSCYVPFTWSGVLASSPTHWQYCSHTFKILKTGLGIVLLASPTFQSFLR